MDARRQATDDSRFDTLVRALATPSRRALFAALTATLVGGALGLSADEAAARRTRDKRGNDSKRGKRKGHNGGQDAVQATGKKKKKKKKKKVPTATSPIAAPPPTGGTPPPDDTTPPGDPCDGVTCAPVSNGFSFCQNGRCVIGCINGTSLCGTTCVDVQTDPANCGTCGNRCSDQSKCQSGICVPACDTGLTLCGSTCVNTKTHGSHCGTCDYQCTDQGAATCGTNGTCADGVCQKYPLWTQCNTYSCIDGVQHYPDSCDGLGNCSFNGGHSQCLTGRCSGSFCVLCNFHTDCPSDRWCERDTGRCLFKRNVGATCDGAFQCQSGFCVSNYCCNSACVADNGTATCGHSGTSAAGTCTVTCAAGWGNCDGDTSNGCETELNEDGNCGACGVTCPTTTCPGPRGQVGSWECIDRSCQCSIPEVG